MNSVRVSSVIERRQVSRPLPVKKVSYSALDCHELQDFFKMQPNSLNSQIAQVMTESVSNDVLRALDNGILSIPCQTDTMAHPNNLIKPHKKHKLELEFELLKGSIQSEKFKSLREQEAIYLSQADHKRQVSKIRKQKKQVDQKRQRYVQELIREREEELNKQTQEKESAVKRLNSEKRTKMAQVRNERMQNKLRRINSPADKEPSNRKLLYRELQEKYIRQVVLPAIQEKNQRLKDAISLKRSVKISQIRQHEQQYMQRRELMVSESANIKIQKNPYEPSFRSGRFEKIRRDEQTSRRVLQEERKASLDAKGERVAAYRKYLVDNFKPSVSESKRLQLEEKVSRLSHSVKSPKIDLRQIGNQYLQFSKKHTQKIASPPSNPEQVSQRLCSSSRPNYIRTNIKPQLSRVQRLNNLLTSTNLSASDKLYELKIETQKIDTLINEKQKLSRVRELRDKHDSSDLLLASIKARMGMLELCNT